MELPFIYLLSTAPQNYSTTSLLHVTPVASGLHCCLEASKVLYQPVWPSKVATYNCWLMKWLSLCALFLHLSNDNATTMQVLRKDSWHLIHFKSIAINSASVNVTIPSKDIPLAKVQLPSLRAPNRNDKNLTDIFVMQELLRTCLPCLGRIWPLTLPASCIEAGQFLGRILSGVEMRTFCTMASVPNLKPSP